MAAFEIPFSAKPQVMSIPLADTTYTLRIRYNQFMAVWVMDIFDNIGTPLIDAIPLVAGTDLLRQFGYLEFGGRIIAQTDHAVDSAPTFENLGINGHVYFVTP